MRIVLKRIIYLVVFLTPWLGQAQKITAVELSAGPVIPVGKDLSDVYSMGFRLGIGPRLQVQKIGLIPEASVDLYINNPTSAPGVRDNLFLYSLQLKASYAIALGKVNIEPVAGVGYGGGTNFITTNAGDFTGGYFSTKGNLVKLQGVLYTLGCMTTLSRKISVGIHYRLQRPNASLTEEAKEYVPYNASTQLYGSIIEFPTQKMKLDNLFFDFTIRL